MVLHLAYEDGLKLQSNTARQYAQTIAAAASLGLLTTYTVEGFGRTWRPTHKGMEWAHLGRSA